jgi:hypothetical protein
MRALVDNVERERSRNTATTRRIVPPRRTGAQAASLFRCGADASRRMGSNILHDGFISCMTRGGVPG